MSGDIRLAAYVSAGAAYDWGCYARLDLSPRTAAMLLMWRTRWDTVQVVAGRDLYAIRAWDYRVRFYNRSDHALPNLDWADEIEGDWDALPNDAEDFPGSDEVNTDADTVEVDERGIRWHAYAGDIPIETGDLSWEQLEAIAAGHDPSRKEETAAS